MRNCWYSFSVWKFSFLVCSKLCWISVSVTSTSWRSPLSRDPRDVERGGERLLLQRLVLGIAGLRHLLETLLRGGLLKQLVEALLRDHPVLDHARDVDPVVVDHRHVVVGNVGMADADGYRDDRHGDYERPAEDDRQVPLAQEAPHRGGSIAACP